jgi:F-type H+-transporting ATPase subunit b
MRAPPEGLQQEDDSTIDDVRDELTIDDGTLVDPYAEIGEDAIYGAWYEDTNLWVLVAFLIVLGILFWQGVHKRIARGLRTRSEGIQAQLDEARTLREEAQQLLAQYQKRQREAEEEAKGIIEQAKADAKIMKNESRQLLDEQIARRRKAAEERIARAEAQAIASVRGEAASLAVAAAREIIADRASDRKSVDSAIAAVGRQLN